MTDELPPNDTPETREALWQVTNAALAELSAAGVPDDDPRVQAALGQLDEIEYAAAVAYMARAVEEK